MRWTEQQLSEYNLRRVKAGDQKPGACPVFQEQQADSAEPKDGQALHHVLPQEEGMDGGSNTPAHVSITWLVSDKRRRDAWGMSETVADCIVSAVRRFLGLHDTRTAKRGKGGKGK